MDASIYFSVIMPVFNSKAILKRAVFSIENQSFSNYELIVIDDGSTDGSGDLCDVFAANNERIRVVHQPNRGQSFARLKGLELAKGDYVLFLDSDDYYETNALELLAKELANNPVDVVLFNAVKRTATDSTELYSLGGKSCLNTKTQILTECFSTRVSGYFWTYCFKRELFELDESVLKRFAEIKYSEDFYLIYQMLSKNAESLLVLPTPLYNYVIRDESITHNQTAEKVKDRFDVFNGVYSSLYEDFQMVPNHSVRVVVGWTYLSYLTRAAKEYECSAFIESCKAIRKSFIYKKMSNFKKDGFSLLIHWLFKLRMYKMAFIAIRKR